MSDRVPASSSSNTVSVNNSRSSRDISHSAAHYLLAIHKLKEDKGYSRVTDMAKDLGLTKGTVSIAVGGLKKRGLVTEEEGSRFPVLTDRGHDEVHRILSSRTLLYYFLHDFVGVSRETAERDACNMEHLLSRESSDKFFEFIKGLACTCQGEHRYPFDFKTTLDFCKFENVDEFIESQKGDSHLQDD